MSPPLMKGVKVHEWANAVMELEGASQARREAHVPVTTEAAAAGDSGYARHLPSQPAERILFQLLIKHCIYNHSLAPWEELFTDNDYHELPATVRAWPTRHHNQQRHMLRATYAFILSRQSFSSIFTGTSSPTLLCVDLSFITPIFSPVWHFTPFLLLHIPGQASHHSDIFLTSISISSLGFTTSFILTLSSVL